MPMPTLQGRQTILEMLLIMAYNTGRAHVENARHAITPEEGRQDVLHIQKLVEDVDPGDLARSAQEYINANPRKFTP